MVIAMDLPHQVGTVSNVGLVTGMMGVCQWLCTSIWVLKSDKQVLKVTDSRTVKGRNAGILPFHYPYIFKCFLLPVDYS